MPATKSEPRWRGRLPILGRARAQREQRRKTPERTYRPVAGRIRLNRIPTLAEIETIPCVPVTEFELSDKETRTLRGRLYGLNKLGHVRYRTLREGAITLVWRIA